jgi:hypothetical protein
MQDLTGLALSDLDSPVPRHEPTDIEGAIRSSSVELPGMLEPGSERNDPQFTHVAVAPHDPALDPDGRNRVAFDPDIEGSFTRRSFSSEAR